jgi:hypothetical protein
MKIFFLAPVQGKDALEDNYRFIVKQMESLGHKVESSVLFNTTKKQLDEWEGSESLQTFQKQIVDKIKDCDVLVIEITHQRVSTGYWISLALELGKPTVALYMKGEKYHLLKTLEFTQKFTIFEYTTLAELGSELPILINFAADQQDTRFNFFISPKHQSYLDWIAKHLKVPRSVYLRNLIEEDMQKNESFKKGV